MGLLFDFLVMRELMKKQNMQPVNDTTFQSNNGGITKVYSDEDTCYKQFLQAMKNTSSRYAVPKILSEQTFKDTSGKKMHLVRFEDGLKPASPSDISQADYDDLANVLEIATAYRKKHPIPSNDPRMEKFRKVVERNKTLAAIAAIIGKHVDTDICKINLTTESFMLRGKQLVIVDPFINK